MGMWQYLPADITFKKENDEIFTTIAGNLGLRCFFFLPAIAIVYLEVSCVMLTSRI